MNTTSFTVDEKLSDQRLDVAIASAVSSISRSRAQQSIRDGCVQVNGHAAKPAKEIRPGDRLRLTYATRAIEIEVLGVPVSAKNVKTPPEELYRVTAEQRLPDEQF